LLSTTFYAYPQIAISPNCNHVLINNVGTNTAYVYNINSIENSPITLTINYNYQIISVGISNSYYFLVSIPNSNTTTSEWMTVNIFANGISGSEAFYAYEFSTVPTINIGGMYSDTTGQYCNVPFPNNNKLNILATGGYGYYFLLYVEYFRSGSNILY